MSRGRRLAVLWAVMVLVSVAGASLIVLTDAGEPVSDEEVRGQTIDHEYFHPVIEDAIEMTHIDWESTGNLFDPPIPCLDGTDIARCPGDELTRAGSDPERCCRDRFALIKDIEDAIVAIDEGQLNEASEILKSAIRNVE